MKERLRNTGVWKPTYALLRYHPRYIPVNVLNPGAEVIPYRKDPGGIEGCR